jgi:epoxyqueuosine reductase
MTQTDELHRIATEAGLVGFGVCAADPFDETRAEMATRLRDGTAGRTRFTYKDPERACDVTRSFPWARHLVVGALAYVPGSGNPVDGAGRGRVARFATEDHYRPLRAALQAMADQLVRGGHEAEILVDDDRLVDRAAAVRAGIGWWGKNTMVLAPKYGPWLLLGSVATDADLTRSEPMGRDCGTCAACIPACPTGALTAPGKLDATLCISYWAQTPGEVPAAVRDHWGNRLYGCDDCLEACPPGSRLLESAPSSRGVDLIRVLGASDEELRERFDHFYLPGRKTSTLRRNALLALAHAGGEGSEAAIRSYADHRDPALAASAAWALDRLGYSAGVEGDR